MLSVPFWLKLPDCLLHTLVIHSLTVSDCPSEFSRVCLSSLQLHSNSNQTAKTKAVKLTFAASKILHTAAMALC